MTVGIPDYRLPRELLNAEIDNIRRAGVEIRCNVALGRDFTLEEPAERDGYTAIVLAIGAHTAAGGWTSTARSCQAFTTASQMLRDIALGRRLI